MTRSNAIKQAFALVDKGTFFNCLKALVAEDTGSGAADRKARHLSYFTKHIIPWLGRMHFKCRIAENPTDPDAPFLIAQRIEDNSRPTILIYGHGDTVPAMSEKWDKNLSPLDLTCLKDQDTGQIRWYGRGIADNKGQHAINLAALECVLKERGKLGFNTTILMESGEEEGSPGLHRICEMEKKALRADVLFASDGPRINPDTPTIFGGSRAMCNFDIEINLRKGEHHSGNWGGILANPGVILSHAIASMVDAKGKILVEALRPAALPAKIIKVIDKLKIDNKGRTATDTDWGEPGLSTAQKVYGWNTLDVLSFECGNPNRPVNAIPSRAWARCHVRFIPGFNPEKFLPAIQDHLDAKGFSMATITEIPNNYGLATRMAPDNPWIRFAESSLEKTCGKTVAFLPNIGGSLPNDAFSHILNLDTIWIPHSYRGCCQHAPNEHMLLSVIHEGLSIMTGLFWDLGDMDN